MEKHRPIMQEQYTDSSHSRYTGNAIKNSGLYKYKDALPGFCDNGLSIAGLGELLPSFGKCGSTNRRLLKRAYLTKHEMSCT